MKKIFEIYGCIMRANIEGFWDYIKESFKGEDKSIVDVFKAFFFSILIFVLGTFLLIWILSTGVTYYPKQLWKKIKKGK